MEPVVSYLFTNRTKDMFNLTRLTSLAAVIGALAIAAPVATAAPPPASPVAGAYQAGISAAQGGYQAGLAAAQGGFQAGANAIQDTLGTGALGSPGGWHPCPTRPLGHI